jgi:hypothetical protein
MTEDRGVGQCPDRAEGFGHIWKSWKIDPRRSCEFCGHPGRDNIDLGETGGYFAKATAARHEIFAGLKAPMDAGSGKVRDLSDAQKAKAAEIVEDKKRRDALARESGVGRPGQLRGK